MATAPDTPANRALFKAIAAGSADQVFHAICVLGADPNAAQGNGNPTCSALMRATERGQQGDATLVATLLELGASPVGSIYATGRDPLSEALRMGYLEVVQAFEHHLGGHQAFVRWLSEEGSDRAVPALKGMAGYAILRHPALADLFFDLWDATPAPAVPTRDAYSVLPWPWSEVWGSPLSAPAVLKRIERRVPRPHRKDFSYDDWLNALAQSWSASPTRLAALMPKALAQTLDEDWLWKMPPRPTPVGPQPPKAPTPLAAAVRARCLKAVRAGIQALARLPGGHATHLHPQAGDLLVAAGQSGSPPMLRFLLRTLPPATPAHLDLALAWVLDSDHSPHDRARAAEVLFRAGATGTKDPPLALPKAAPPLWSLAKWTPKGGHRDALARRLIDLGARFEQCDAAGRSALEQWRHRAPDALAQLRAYQLEKSVPQAVAESRPGVRL